MPADYLLHEALYLSKKVRMLVASRANFRCEYCKVHEADSFLPFQIEHIISLKHGGGNELANLAYACPHCNQHKGTDLTTFIDSYLEIVVIFNPRQHEWFDHFLVANGEIVPKSKIGQATVKLLQLNDTERLIHRQILMEDGRYPG